jgi:hypothetical protein
MGEGPCRPELEAMSKPPGITGHASDQSEERFWKLYRQERKKLAPSFRTVLTSAQIVHAARAARKRMGRSA